VKVRPDAEAARSIDYEEHRPNLWCFSIRDQGANGGDRLLSRPPRSGARLYRVVARSHLCIYYTVRFPSESNI
jgi:hypothetical protein